MDIGAIILEPLTVYTSRASYVDGFKSRSMIGNAPVIHVEGGAINIYVGHQQENLTLAKFNPVEDETILFFPTSDYISYSVVSGAPVVTCNEGVLEKVTLK